MVQKLLKSMVQASQDALLGNNPVLAFKTMQRIETAIDQMGGEETPAVSTRPAKPEPESPTKESQVYPELLEREPTPHEEEPAIQIIEHQPLKKHLKLLGDVDVKAAKLGMGAGLADKEEPGDESELPTSEETVIEDDDGREPSLASLGQTPPGEMIIDEQPEDVEGPTEDVRTQATE